MEVDRGHLPVWCKLASVENARQQANPMRQDALAFGKRTFLSGPHQVGKTTLAKSVLVAKGWVYPVASNW
jgi:MoxR-like ATPase